MHDGAQAARSSHESAIPGEPGIWILVLGDLFVFALFFGTFAYYRLEEPSVFRLAQETLDQGSGLANTLLLLTSSWSVARALEAMRAARHGVAARFVLGAMATGATFVVIKALEYHAKIEHGLVPTTNNFFMLYFVFTGIHLIHVLIGLILLALMRRWVRPAAAGGAPALAECAAIFWHLVDVLWVVLFAIFYLHR